MSKTLASCGIIMRDRFVSGEEQRFKVAVMQSQRALHAGLTIFEIENEEKEPGFPDTLEMGEIGTRWASRLVEYKVSDKNGYVTFRKDQPRFYRYHAKLNIDVCTWSVPDQAGYYFSASEIVDALLNSTTERFTPRTIRLSIAGGVITI